MYPHRENVLVLFIILSCIFPLSGARGKSNVNVPEGFVEIHPDTIDWHASREVSGLKSANLIGDPESVGPLLVRIEFPPNIRIEPHSHINARTYTVLSGEWKIGFGAVLEPERLLSFGPGATYRLPAGVIHYQEAGPEGAVVQVESIGPTSFDFVNKGKTWSFSK